MTGNDIREFQQYLEACTDSQVYRVWQKEVKANRDDYAALAYIEMQRRELT